LPNQQLEENMVLVITLLENGLKKNKIFFKILIIFVKYIKKNKNK
jgi:hypothetical protein